MLSWLRTRAHPDQQISWSTNKSLVKPKKAVVWNGTRTTTLWHMAHTQTHAQSGFDCNVSVRNSLDSVDYLKCVYCSQTGQLAKIKTETEERKRMSDSIQMKQISPRRPGGVRTKLSNMCWSVVEAVQFDSWALPFTLCFVCVCFHKVVFVDVIIADVITVSQVT